MVLTEGVRSVCAPSSEPEPQVLDTKARPHWSSYVSTGSKMPWSGLQVKAMVMAYRVPQCTFSTRCRFSEPEVKKETRPGRREAGVTDEHDSSVTRVLFERVGVGQGSRSCPLTAQQMSNRCVFSPPLPALGSTVLLAPSSTNTNRPPPKSSR